MAAIIPSISVDNDITMSRHFLPYQVAWILDESRMMLAEKSVRIGWTYADAFRNVRKRIQHKNRDYLFATKDQASAIEYLGICKKFIELYKLTKNVLTTGEETHKVKGPDGIIEEIKFWYIKFTNGSRIIAFSANPLAMAVYGGDVGLDEFAKAANAELLWETAQGRVTWGYDIAVWSAHNGTDTLFYQFVEEAKAGKGGWNHYRVTMQDAVDMGLTEKINEVSGQTQTREQFIADCKNRARLPEVYEQAYNCNPSGSASSIVSWTQISQCRRDYPIERLHLESHQITQQFGAYSEPQKLTRQARIREHIIGVYKDMMTTPARRYLGFDVAASGQGDLCAIYIDREEGNAQRLEALFTCRTDDWDFIETVLWTFIERLGGLKGCGDETGLGKQVCWRTAQKFSQFRGVNFSSEKHDMGHELMNQLAVAEKIIPLATEHADIAQDYFAMRKTFGGGRWIFTSGRNNLNPASHGDIAWAGALASRARVGISEGSFDAAAIAQTTIAPAAITRPRFRPVRL
jgi:phage FluMu gp28-like protein